MSPLTKKFRQYVRVTGGFFLLRFLCAIVVAFLYIFIAAFIQDVFVRILGESSFNYIVGGLLSLFLGVLFCHYIGSLTFMFIKGWHVSALAYAPKIVKSHAPALPVGVAAFNKNLVSFGAVYGVRILLKNVLEKFKTKLWELSDDIPFASTLKRVADNPIVEYISSDVLHYAFDAGIFYLVRHPPEDLNEVPSTLLTAVKKYLYAIPSILMSSVQSYLLFRFLPKLIKWVTFLWVLFTQGLVAGVLIIVLMFPIYYILDNALFDPLTMVMFLAAYAKVCEKEQNPEDPIVKLVDSIMDSDDADDGGDAEEVATTLEDEVEEKPAKKSVKPKSPPPSSEEEPVASPVEEGPVLPSDEELFGTPSEGGGQIPLSALSAFAQAAQGSKVDFRNATPTVQQPVQAEEAESIVEPTIDFTQTEDVTEAQDTEVEDLRSGGGLSAIFGGLAFGDLDEDPLKDSYADSDSTDRAQSILLGDEE